MGNGFMVKTLVCGVEVKILSVLMSIISVDIQNLYFEVLNNYDISFTPWANRLEFI